MSLVVSPNPPPDDTCYPATIAALLELLAPYLSAPTQATGQQWVYAQVAAPTGVAIGTIWINPDTNVLQVWTDPTGASAPSWSNGIQLPANWLASASLVNGSVTETQLSSSVLAKLNAASQSTQTACIHLEEQFGGGSSKANFYVMSDGGLRACGANASNKNGVGGVTSADNSFFPRRCGFNPPLTENGYQVALPPPATGFTADTVAKVYAMHACTFVLTAAGAVYAAGLNHTAGIGQLGLNDTSTANFPVFTMIPQASFGGDPVKQLAIGTGLGSYLSCMALTTTGNVYAWGHNNYGTLGQGNTTGLSIPTKVTTLGQTATQIAMAGSGSDESTSMKTTAYVLLTDGTVQACGYNGTGQLGTINTNNASTFAVVPGLDNAGTALCTEIIVAAGEGVAGANTTAYFLRKNLSTDPNPMQLWGVGDNTNGQLATGSFTTPVTAIVQLGSSATAPEYIREVKTISGAAGKTTVVFIWGVAVTVTGCGYNANGQLGNGNTTHQSTLVSSDVVLNAVNQTPLKLGIGGNNGKIAVAVLTDAGLDPTGNQLYNVFTAGSNQEGQLGQGNPTDSSTFQQALVDTQEIAAVGFGANNDSSSTATFNLLLRLNNGSVLACGYDNASYGQLGVDSTPSAIGVPAFVRF